MGTVESQRVSLNFGFLHAVSPAMEATAAQAERLLHVDAAACVVKVRVLGEMLSHAALGALGVSTAGMKFADCIGELSRRGALTPDVRAMFHAVRDTGNRAAHENTATPTGAQHLLHLAWRLALWCRRTVEPGTFKQPAWNDIPDPSAAQRAMAEAMSRLQRELDEQRRAHEAARTEALSLAEQSERWKRELEAALHTAEKADEERAIWETLADEASTKLSAALAAQASQNTVTDAVLARAQEAGSTEALDLDEADTRVLIDAQLRAAGWEADTEQLTYAKGARPTAGRALAIAEWPTRDGIADYVLFDGLTAVAVIEAKRKRIDVPGAVEQSRRYSRGWSLDGTHTLAAGAPWDGHHVPLLYATNGRPYLAQLPDRSGIHLVDARRATNLPRVLTGWHSPEGVRALLAHDPEAVTARLAAQPIDALGLRAYQNEAILSVERALAEGRRHCLLAMATGTGKTRTALGLIYRLLTSRRARRVLFLVDREVLASQTLDTFKSAPVDGSLSLSQIFEVVGPGETPQPETRVHVATVQSLVRRIMDAESIFDVPRIDLYDVVIVDECHRGYALDRDLSEVELGFRDEAAYLSKYRRVLDHFDAVRIGITATPALHTTQIFGRPIYEYTFRQAVLDGHLVDSDVPVRIETKLSRDGIRWTVGDTVTRYDRTRQTVDLATLEDDVAFDVEQFNRSVLTEGFNRAVCGWLAPHLDPHGRRKTLVFCVDDAHADLVVRLLREELQKVHADVPAAAVQKITGRSDNVKGLVQRYKNEQLPVVAVTVDLLTTGVDVPAITSLVFLRMVRSRVLYEQMLGRATRLCRDLNKTSFTVWDAVGVTEQMANFTAMRPVVVNPVFRFEQLAHEVMDASLGDDARALALEQLVAKLQRRRRTLSDGALADLEARAGEDAASLVRTLRTSSPAEVSAWLKDHPGVVRVLDEGETRPETVLVSEHADVVLRADPSLGMAPDDYLEAFGRWLETHVNEVPALRSVVQRPRDLTREGLKQVREALEGAGFSEAKVRTAWKMKANHEIAAGIVGFIRQRALGDALVPYDTRVEHALATVLTAHPWTDEQRQWLTKIASQMKSEVVVDRAALDRGAFTSIGGARKAERVFAGQLDEVLGELHDAVWETAVAQ